MKLRYMFLCFAMFCCTAKVDSIFSTISILELYMKCHRPSFVDKTRACIDDRVNTEGATAEQIKNLRVATIRVLCERLKQLTAEDKVSWSDCFIAINAVDQILVDFVRYKIDTQSKSEECCRVVECQATDACKHCESSKNILLELARDILMLVGKEGVLPGADIIADMLTDSTCTSNM